MSKEIELTQGLVALVDDDDYERVSKHSWYIEKSGRGYIYARTKTKNVRILMHRFILGAPSDKVVDHLNHKTLDNRKCNLRVCSIRDNNNNSLARKNTSSKYKGVYFCKHLNKWKAEIKKTHIGCFNNEIDAAKAYDEKAKELYNEYACINFPSNGERSAIEVNEYIPIKRKQYSNHKGVGFIKRTGRWVARLTIAGKRTHIGCYDTEAAAISARDKFLKELK